MAMGTGLQHIGQAHGVVDRRHRDATIGRLGQDQSVIFDVMADLKNRRILQQILQGGGRGGEGICLGPSTAVGPARSKSPCTSGARWARGM